jgi:hypothetical protein
MDLQITKVSLSKEITWDSVQNCRELFVEMMRNRVTIEAIVAFPRQMVDMEKGIMFDKFMKDIRRDLDGNNVGLYAFQKHEQFFLDGHRAYKDRDDFRVDCDSARGQITVFFEDHTDYARFVKEHAVMFKLSAI